MPQSKASKMPPLKNPFVSELTLSTVDKLLICLNAMILLPVRVFSIFILLFFCTLIAHLTTFGLSENDLNEKPLTGCRRFGKKLIRIMCRSIAFCCGFHYIAEKGKRATRARAPILVYGPHVSFFDTIALFLFDIPCAVSRIENARIPVFGAIIRAMQPIFVDRQDKNSRRRVAEEIRKRADWLVDWPQIAIFPEGTTTNGTCLINFKSGAFLPGKTVQPVVIEYKNRLNIFPWTLNGLNAYQLFFLTLCQLNNRMLITYMPAYRQRNKNGNSEKEFTKLFANNVKLIMSKKLSIASTEHTFEDYLLMIDAEKLNLPIETGLIEFATMKEQLNVDYQECKLKLARFAEIKCILDKLSPENKMISEVNAVFTFGEFLKKDLVTAV